jgi:hypothetical protein
MGMKSEDKDPLEGGPPQPKLRDAKPSVAGSIPSAMPSPSASAMSMIGAGPAREVVEGMATIEMMVKQISKHVPAIQTVFSPAVIEQMRTVAMAGLANLSQGGIGGVDLLGAGATPPPGMVPPAGAAPGGVAGPGIMPMPPGPPM